jgi:predicted ribosomally synthesized peptide with nif11-like leader
VVAHVYSSFLWVAIVAQLEDGYTLLLTAAAGRAWRSPKEAFVSRHEVEEFLDRLENDAELHREWQAAFLAAVQSAMVALAAKHGHRFTLADLTVTIQEREATLNDEELARVHGGLNPQPEPPIPMLDLRRLLSLSLLRPR